MKPDKKQETYTHQIAQEHVEAGRLPEAAQAYNKIIEKERQDEIAWNNLSDVYLRMGRLKKAETIIRAGLEIKGPKHDELKIMLVNVLTDNGEFESALNIGLEMHPNHSTHPILNALIARIFDQLQDYQQALPYHIQGVSDQPDHGPGHVNLANAYERTGNIRKAIEHWLKVIELLKKTKAPFLSSQEQQQLMAKLMVYGVIPVKDDFEIRSLATFEDALSQGIFNEVKKVKEGFLIPLQNMTSFSGEWFFMDGAKAYMDLHFTASVEGRIVAFGENGKVILSTREAPHINVDEPCILLGGGANYYHWMIDFLPRWALIQQWPDWKSRKIVVNGNLQSYQRETLEMLGVKEEQLCLIPMGHYATFKDIVVPFFQGRKFRPNREPDWLEPAVTKMSIEWLRNTFQNYMSKDKPKKRIFVSREGAKMRRCLNEMELQKIATQTFDYELVYNEGLSVKEQIKLYSHAQSVIGVHGAGFTNLVFAPKECHLMEMAPKSRLPKFYQKLTRLIGQNHRELMGKCVEKVLPLAPEFWNFEIQDIEFKKKLAECHPDFKEEETSEEDQEILDTMQEAMVSLKEGQDTKAESLLWNKIRTIETGKIAENAIRMLCKISQKTDYLVQAGVILYNNGKIDESSTVLSKVVALDPKNAAGWNNLANNALKIGLIKEAQNYYSKAYSLTQDEESRSKIAVNRLKIFSSMDRSDKAVDLGLSYLKKRPKDYPLLVAVASAYAELGEFDKALEKLAQTVKIKPESITAHYLTGLIYNKKKDYARAVTHWKKTVELFDKQDIAQELAPEKVRWLRWMINTQTMDPQKDKWFFEQTFFQEAIQRDKKNFEIHKDFPEAHVIKFKKAKIYADTWEVIKDKTVYTNLLFHTEQKELRIIKAINDKGCLISELSDDAVIDQAVFLGGCKNYYHWVIDYLPRLSMIENDETLKALPLLMNEEMMGYQKASLELIGFDFSKVINVKKGAYTPVNELYIPDFKNRQFDADKSPEWLIPVINRHKIDWLRQRYQKYRAPRSDLPKRIFISRKGAPLRQCSNEDAVFELAQKYGFEKIKNEDYSYADQIALYAGAEAVMGAHGAGFTNIVFGAPNLQVIEMHSKGNMPVFFEELAGSLGQKHIKIEGQISRMLQSSAKAFWDFEVDLDDVKKALKRL